MPTYDGTYKLAVEDGRTLIRDVEGGSLSTHVPLEIYSNYAAQGTLTDSRQLRLRTQPYLESNPANAYVTDMGIQNTTDNYFFITAPQNTSTVGDQNTFVISSTSNVGIGTTDPQQPLHVVGDSWITGTLTTSNIVGASPVTISSNLVMASGFTLTAETIAPPPGGESNLNITGTITTSNITHETELTVTSNLLMGSDKTLTTSNITHESELTVTSNLLMGSDKTLTTSNITHESELTVTSNLLMGSDKTLTTSNIIANTGNNLLVGSNLVVASGTTLTGGSTASITNSNTFPKFIFSRNANASLNHVGGAHNTAKHVVLPSDDGKAWATGGGFVGALGLGDTTNRNVYTLVSALDGVANIVASSATGVQGSSAYEQTILLDDTGNVWTCGINQDGQQGHGDTKTRYIPTLVTTNIYSGVSITEVSAGSASELVLDSTGQIWGAGYNGDYRIGNLSGVAGTALSNTTSTFIPSMPAGDHTFTSIDNGRVYGLALEDNGRIWSTGANGDGRAGGGATDPVPGWTLCPDGTTTSPALSEVSITQIVTGEYHSMALDSTGNVWATGDNGYGQLGLGDTTDRSYFERVTANVNVAANPSVTITKIAAAAYRTWALDTAGKMWFAGNNLEGLAGQPPYVNTVNTFIRADAGPIADKSITDFALGSYASPIVRTSDNEYWVNGYGGNGSLGTGDTINRYIYTKILDVNANPPKDYGYTRSLLLENTETGKGPSIELKNKNSISSRIQMEDGASGKMNIGFVDASFDPKFSGGDGAVLEPFQERAQSNTMTRGVIINQSGGTMVAGGETANVGFNAPFFNSGLAGMANYGLYAGTERAESYVIAVNGKLYGWGINDYGQLGVGDETARTNIVEIDTSFSDYPIVAVGNGEWNTMVADSAGYLYSVGRNNVGQLAQNLDPATYPSTNVWASCAGSRCRSMAVGNNYALVLGAGSPDLFVVGGGANGALGLNDVNLNLQIFTQVSGANVTWSGNITAVFTSAPNTSFLITDHATSNLWATGKNNVGQLGVGDSSDKLRFTACTGYTGTPKMVGGGFNHSYMVNTAGKVYACGDYTNGSLGISPEPVADVLSWTACTGDINNVTIIQVVGEGNAGCALDSTGNVWVVGSADSRGVGQGVDNYIEFTKVTIEPFASANITQISCAFGTFYAVDTEGNFWLATRDNQDYTAPGYIGEVSVWSKTNIYTVIPKEFKYTPTLTLENPNPDYGATIEFKNPNNRAFINLDDKTSTLRLGFVDNEYNAGQFRGLSINGGGNVGIGITVPTYKLHVDGISRLNQFAGSRSGTFSGSGTFDLPANLDYGSGTGTAPAIGWEIHMVFGFTGNNGGTFSLTGAKFSNNTDVTISEPSSFQFLKNGTYGNYNATCYLTDLREVNAPAYYAKITMTQVYNNNIANSSNMRFHIMYDCVGCRANIGASRFQGAGFVVIGNSSLQPKFLRFNCSTGSVRGNYMVNPLTT